MKAQRCQEQYGRVTNGVMWRPTSRNPGIKGLQILASPRKAQRCFLATFSSASKPVQNPRSALPPENIVHCFTHTSRLRPLERWTPQFRPSVPPAQPGSGLLGADFSGLTFSGPPGTPTAAMLAPSPPRGPQACGARNCQHHCSRGRGGISPAPSSVH